MAPVVGLNRISPGSRLVDNEFTRKALEVVTATITGSIVLEKTGENKYTITWTQPSGDDRALTIPAMGADDQFTFNDATQTLTNKALTGVTDLDMTSGNKTILDTIGSNTLTIGAGGTTVVIAGNLTVSGTTTTVNTGTLNIADSLYVLNSDEDGTPSQDSGFIVERGTSTNVGLFWDESVDEFVFVNTSEDGSTAGNVTIASYANLQVAKTTGTSLVLDGNKSVTPGDGGVVHIDTHTITDSSTSSSGTATKYTHVAIEAPTLAATNSSVTTTDVATFYISGATTAGTNQTLTRNYAMWVDAGNVRFDGSIYTGTIHAMNSSGLLQVTNQSNVAGVGTITSGVWNGTAIDGGYINDNIVSGQAEITSGLAAADELLYSDAGTVKRVGVDNFIELAPALSTEDAIANGDYILFLDGGASGNMNKEAVHDLATLFAGTGLTAASSIINIDAAQSGITSLGTLTGLTLDGDKSVTPGDGAMIHLDTSTITDSSTSGSGTATKYTHVNFEAPTLAATNSSVTTTDAATVYINAALTAGTNQTLTRNYALWVDAGNVRFDGSIYSGTTHVLNSSGIVQVAAQTGITAIANLVTVGALDSGSITSGFTSIDVGSGGLTTSGAISGGTIDASTDFTIGTTVITDDSIVMTPTTSDTVTIAAATHGALSITTVDNDAAAANIQITADGTVDIDSAGVLTLDSGAAINIEPASGSAILLDGTISIDAGAVTGATSVTSTAFVGDITGDVTGTADVATVATTVTITDNESTDEDNAIIFTAGGDVDGGNIGLESDGTLTYNPSTGKITATGFIGALTGDVTGTADTATVATTVTITDNESTDEDNAITFTAGGDVDGGNIGLESDGTLTYNPSTGKVTATGFVGTLTGNVTGNTSGTALTVTQAAQTAITSVGTLTALQVDYINANASTLTITDSSDTGDYSSIVTTTHGATTITTVDDDAAAANFLITADGTVDIDSAGILTLDSGAAINIEPASGSAILLDGTISVDAGVVTGATSITSTAFVGALTGNASGTAATVTTAAQAAITSLGTLTALQVDYINANASTVTVTDSSDTGDYASLAVTTHGATTLTTVDDDAHAANLAVTVDGSVTIDAVDNIELDSATGIFIFEDGGTEVLRLTEGNSGDVTVKLAVNAKDLIFTDNGDAEGFKILDGAAGVRVAEGLNVAAATISPVDTAHNAAGTAISIASGNTTAATTNNIAGGSLTIKGGRGKGSGAGGDIIFQTANAGGSGSALNALATALTISDDLSATFAGAVIGSTTIDATTDFTIGTTVITDGSIVMTPSTSDTVTIAAATNGVLNITTVDNASAAANLNLTIDGKIDANVTSSIEMTTAGILEFITTSNGSNSILIEADGGTDERITIHADQGTDAGVGVSSINLTSDVGGISITSTGLDAANAILLTATAGGITLTADDDITLATDGKLYLNETADADVTTGMVINQGAADDGVLSFKSSDVSHTFTTTSPTYLTNNQADTYGRIQKAQITGGGVRIMSFSDSNSTWGNMILRGFMDGTPTTAHSTTGYPMMLFDVYHTDGSNGSQAPPTNSNAFGLMTNGATVQFIVDVEGDIHYNGSVAGSAFDAYDDISLLRAVQRSVAPQDVITKEFDQFLTSNEDDLIALGILGGSRIPDENGDRGLICLTKLTQLLTGGVVQLYEKIIDRDKRIEALENKVLAIGG